MASKKPTVQSINTALKTLGYGQTVMLDKPFYENISKNNYTFYIPKIKGSIDTRRIFLSDISKKLNKNRFSTFYDVNDTGASSVGKVVFVGESFYIVCKYFESSKKTTEGGGIQLKPSNISPSIVDSWITAENIVKNVKSYVKKSNVPKPLSDQINLLLNNSLTTDRSFIIDGDVSSVMVPAEFFEILTAIKMSVLLRNNESELKNVLKFLDRSKNIDYKFEKNSPVKINIPKKSNFPLTDYELSFKPNNYNETIKVSVKSKVKSDNTNTLKFDQIFDTVRDVGVWFRSLSSSIKSKQFAQAQVAYANLRYSTQSKKSPGSVTKKGAPKPKYSGKVKTGFPIDAVGHILQIPNLKLGGVIIERSKFMDGKIKRSPTTKEVRMFAIVCRRIPKIISGVDIKSNLDTIFTKKSEAEMLATVINLISTNNQVNNQPADPNLINLGKYCEKILEWASKESSPSKLFNFYEMFHKKVLEDRAICYAISDSKKHKTSTGIKTEIIFKFETMVNWEKMWIGLRKKDGDALGLDL